MVPKKKLYDWRTTPVCFKEHVIFSFFLLNSIVALIYSFLICTEYGLGSSVYTKDSKKAERIASLIDAGQVGVNCYPLEAMGFHCPWCVFILIFCLTQSEYICNILLCVSLFCSFTSWLHTIICC